LGQIVTCPQAKNGIVVGKREFYGTLLWKKRRKNRMKMDEKSRIRK
jgi:hypothetical protein